MKPAQPPHKTPAAMWAAFAETKPEADAFTQHSMACQLCHPMRGEYCAQGENLRRVYCEKSDRLAAETWRDLVS
jgi:hypothetical protein